MKKKIIKRLNEIKNYFINIDYKKYAKTNILFLTFLVTTVVNGILLRLLTIGNILYIKPLFYDLAIVLLLGSFVYLFKPKRQIFYILFLSILFTVICIINSIYYTFYTSFASVSLLSTSLFVVDVGDAVVKNVLSIKDFTYLFAPITIIFIHFSLRKKDYYSLIEEKGKKLFVKTFLISIGLLFLLLITMSSIEYGRLQKQWNREYLVMKFGMYFYQINDVIKSLEPRVNTLFGFDKAFKEHKEFYEEKEKNTQVITNKYTNVYKGKNVIAIHAESIMTDAIGKSFNGEEVTPNLNNITKQGLYFSNFYSQVSVGTSSDTEFTLATSLLPVTNGTVFVNYWDRKYESMYNYFNEMDYYVASFHANTASFWNRLVMHKNLGYNKFYAKSTYNTDEILGLGLSDKSFFKQTVPKIKKIQEKGKPFFATMIMLSNHTPFDGAKAYDDFKTTMKTTVENEDGVSIEIELPYIEGTKLGNYYNSVHYSDAAIGEFISELDSAGLLENTVVIIYGDHDARLPKKDYEFAKNYNIETNKEYNKDDPRFEEEDYYDYELNRKIPLIIWTKDHKYKKEITTVAGMYDVMPTLGNMFGFTPKYNLGNDLFSKTDNIVVFPNGNWINDKMYYNAQKDEYLLLKDSIVTADEITANKDYANKILDISNNIILYDLIKKTGEDQNEKK